MRKIQKMLKPRYITSALIVMLSFVMSLAYATFRAELGVEGIASIDETFKVNITSITSSNTNNYQGSTMYTNIVSPTTSGTTYEITFKNTVTLKGKLGAIYVLSEGDADVGYKINLEGSSEQIDGSESSNYTTGGGINTKIGIDEEVTFVVTGYCKSTTCTNKTKNLMISFSWIQDNDETSYGNNGYAISLSMEGNATGSTKVVDSNGITVMEKSKTNSSTVTGLGYSTMGNTVTITNTLGENTIINQVSVQTTTGTTITTTCNTDKTSCTFTLPQNNVIVTVSYGYNSFSITKNVGENGTITVTNSSGTEISKAKPGETVKVSYIVNSGYTLDTFTIISGSETICSSYCESFTMPNGEVTITATFSVPILLRDTILEHNDEQSDSEISFSAISSDTNGKGLYYTSTNTENNGTTYYFRGAVTNNYVEFANYYWRIVRINEDGSVRLIKQDSIGMIAFNEKYNDNAYVGYMYGTPGSDSYQETHNNINESIVKQNVDDWYEGNLINYASYLSDAGFCNDRSVAPSKATWRTDDTALGYGTNLTYYGPFNRLRNTNQPQFACPNATNDLFTTATSTKGNKALTYPIGLLTIDEIVYAGGVSGVENSSYYLYKGSSYWTMSPDRYDANAAHAWTGRLALHNDGVSLTAQVFPVINLISNIEITKGDGTSGNPYVIKTN